MSVERKIKIVVAEDVNEEGNILSFGDTNMRTRLPAERGSS